MLSLRVFHGWIQVILLEKRKRGISDVAELHPFSPALSRWVASWHSLAWAEQRKYHYVRCIHVTTHCCTQQQPGSHGHANTTHIRRSQATHIGSPQQPEGSKIYGCAASSAAAVKLWRCALYTFHSAQQDVDVMRA